MTKNECRTDIIMKLVNELNNLVDENRKIKAENEELKALCIKKIERLDYFLDKERVRLTEELNRRKNYR